MNFANNYCPNCKGICVKSIKNMKSAVGIFANFINVMIVAVVFLKQEIPY